MLRGHSTHFNRQLVTCRVGLVPGEERVGACATVLEVAAASGPGKLAAAVPGELAAAITAELAAAASAQHVRYAIAGDRVGRMASGGAL